MPVVSVHFVYENIPWSEVNEHVDVTKRKCLMDPGRVSAEVTEKAGGETVFTYTGQTPVWARLFLPPTCAWRDTVSVDEASESRSEHGENLTGVSDRCFIDERSRWYADGKGTIFERTLEIRVMGFPDAFLRSCLRLYRDSTLKIRRKEAEQIRARTAHRRGDEKSAAGGPSPGVAVVPTGYLSTTAARCCMAFAAWVSFLFIFDSIWFHSRPLLTPPHHQSTHQPLATRVGGSSSQSA